MTSLRSIPGYTLSDLQNMGMTPFLYVPLECGGSTPLSIPNPEPSTLTPIAAFVVKPPSVKVPKPRSKIAHLPEPIQANLNTMLASGRPYMDIVRYLNTQGYSGFNKVNLHDWKKTGFQQWLQNHQQPEAIRSKPEL